MRLRALVLSLCLIGSNLVLPFQVVHAQAEAYSTQISKISEQKVTLAPGEVREVSLAFQNTGTKTWSNDGLGYISLYTYGPKYRASVFDPGTWLSPTQVKRIQQASVAPGETATLAFELHAPQTTGTYTETFALASEDTAWVSGGEVVLTITVAEKTAEESDSISSQEETNGYSGEVVAQTATKLNAKAGKLISFIAVVQNTGTQTWETVSLSDASEVTAAKTGQIVSFAHSTWTGNTALSLSGQVIAPGESVNLQFFMIAPQVNGSHIVDFVLTANNNAVDGVELVLPIEVTGGSGELAESPLTTSEEEFVAPLEEPIMRVGVLIVDEETDWEVTIGSSESDVELRDTEGKLLASIPKGSDLRAAYENGTYEYGAGSSKKTSSLPLRFIPVKENAVLEVTNFDRRETRGTQYANNTFRNILEVRYNDSKDRTWLINELPMEYYLRGLAETSNSSPMEFQKALLTAARTYAYYHYTHASKHAAEGYHVDAYQDQVYWGYGQEERNPLITEAVEATRGHLVTYKGTPAITAYFSRSDGQTRNWSDVWGGNIPYSISVPVPCDEGKTLWGHGVGMSASGAICMANDGKTWDEILKYFYTGIEVTHEWK